MRLSEKPTEGYRDKSQKMLAILTRSMEVLAAIRIL